MRVYRHSDYVGVDYVDVEDFLFVIRQGIADVDIENGEVLTISVVPEEESYIVSRVPMTLTIDPVADTLTYSDFRFVNALYVSSDVEYQTDLGLIASEGPLMATPKTIRLSDYGIDVVHLNADFFIPLALADLILTWEGLNVYPLDEVLYIFDEPENIEDLFEAAFIGPVWQETALVDFTTRFTTLLFDHFYGLKSFRGIDSYQSVFEAIGMMDTVTFTAFDAVLDAFVYDADDLHLAVVDFGLDSADYEPMEPPNGSRAEDYIDALQRSDYRWRDAAIRLIEDEDYYILEVNSFDLDTRDRLAELLDDVDPEKDIIIDLSCNTGGSLIAVYELMTYLTNEPIPMFMTNPATGDAYVDYYQASAPRALDNTFYVYTTAVTFSAANLFASLCKDMKTALVFGQRTGGGAAAVSYVVLPNNLILAYSTNRVFGDGSQMALENGILPYYSFSGGTAIGTAILEVLSIFEDAVNIAIEDHSTVALVDLEFATGSIPSHIVIDHFTVIVTDQSGRILESVEVSDPSFHVTLPVSDPNNLIDVEIRCAFTYMGVELEQTVHHVQIDEMTGDINPGTLAIPVGTTYMAHKYSEDDVDIFRLDISERGMYRILIDNEFESVANRVYDADGVLLGTGSDFVLDPGTYYVRTAYLFREGHENYSIAVERMVDDTVDPTVLDLPEGETDAILRYDYPGDTELILFTVPAEATIRLTITGAGFSQRYFIGDAAGNALRTDSKSLYARDSIEFMVCAGTYTVGLNAMIQVTDIAFRFEVAFVGNDISGNLSDPDDRFGTLVEGDNPIAIDGKWDVDIYTYETDVAVELLISGRARVEACLITEDGLVCKASNMPFTLGPGRHHFRFTSSDPAFSTTATVLVLRDLSSADMMSPIAVGDTFTCIIENVDDVDYYTFTLFDYATIQISFAEDRSTTYRLVDHDGNELFRRSGGDFIYQASPGDYMLEIASNNRETVEFYHVTLAEYETADTDPGSIGQALERYRTFVLPNQSGMYISGNIDYEDDYDFFRLEITETGTYQISIRNSNSVIFNLVDEDGVTTRWSSSYGLTLEAGTYYLKVYSLGISPDDYQWLITKK